MSRRFKAVLVASHLLVLVAGGVIAWQFATRAGLFQQESAGMRGASGRSHGAIHHPARQWTCSEYARAWKALRNGIYTTRERVRLQRDLLERWAEVDLAAAIEAALGEAWDRDGCTEFDPCGPLLGVFSEALAKNPQEGWDMIRGRQFGVGSGMLRRVWMEAVGMNNPQFLASRVAELSWRDRPLAFQICHSAVQSGAGGATAADLFEIFAGLPADVVSAEQLMEFTSPHAGPVELMAMKQEILRLGDDERIGKVKAILLGRALAGKSSDEIADEIEALPQALREEVLWAAFIDNGAPENVLGVVDLLIEEDAWGKLQQTETVRQIQKIACNGAARQVADWAMTLPVRQETIGLFHRSVEPFLAENLESSQRWLDDLPDGFWRDRAAAEFSQVALGAQPDR